AAAGSAAARGSGARAHDVLVPHHGDRTRRHRRRTRGGGISAEQLLLHARLPRRHWLLRSERALLDRPRFSRLRGDDRQAQGARSRTRPEGSDDAMGARALPAEMICGSASGGVLISLQTLAMLLSGVTTAGCEPDDDADGGGWDEENDL